MGGRKEGCGRGAWGGFQAHTPLSSQSGERKRGVCVCARRRGEGVMSLMMPLSFTLPVAAVTFAFTRCHTTRDC